MVHVMSSDHFTLVGQVRVKKCPVVWGLYRHKPRKFQYPVIFNNQDSMECHEVPILKLPGVAFAWKTFQNQSFGTVDESPVERRSFAGVGQFGC